MSKIVFRGKSYNSVFDMPDEIRKAYQIEKHSGKPEAEKLLTDFIEMSDELREIYERVAGNEDIKHREREDRPVSDEQIYRPSPSISIPQKPAIEEDDGPRRLVVSIAVLLTLIIGGAVFFLLQVP